MRIESIGEATWRPGWRKRRELGRTRRRRRKRKSKRRRTDWPLKELDFCCEAFLWGRLLNIEAVSWRLKLG